MKTTITLNVHITFELTDSSALDSDTKDYLARIAGENVRYIMAQDFEACDIDNIRVSDVQHGWSDVKEVR